VHRCKWRHPSVQADEELFAFPDPLWRSRWGSRIYNKGDLWIYHGYNRPIRINHRLKKRETNTLTVRMATEVIIMAPHILCAVSLCQAPNQSLVEAGTIVPSKGYLFLLIKNTTGLWRGRGDIPVQKFVLFGLRSSDRLLPPVPVGYSYTVIRSSFASITEFTFLYLDRKLDTIILLNYSS
jgi:hypothetical protein